MSTTIELPEELLARAQAEAAACSISLPELVVQALEKRLGDPGTPKGRGPLPVIYIADPNAPINRLLSREEIEESMFPIEHWIDSSR